MPEAIVNQVSIHHQITGNGPPLLFLHGLGSSGRDWEIQTSYFSRTHTIMTIDFRGHGESEKPPGPYSIGAFSDDIVAVLIETGLSPVTVVGLSLGGMVGGFNSPPTAPIWLPSSSQ